MGNGHPNGTATPSPGTPIERSISSATPGGLARTESAWDPQRFAVRPTPIQTGDDRSLFLGITAMLCAPNQTLPRAQVSLPQIKPSNSSSRIPNTIRTARSRSSTGYFCGLRRAPLVGIAQSSFLR